MSLSPSIARVAALRWAHPRDRFRCGAHTGRGKRPALPGACQPLLQRLGRERALGRFFPGDGNQRLRDAVARHFHLDLAGAGIGPAGGADHLHVSGNGAAEAVFAAGALEEIGNGQVRSQSGGPDLVHERREGIGLGRLDLNVARVVLRLRRPA